LTDSPPDAPKRKVRFALRRKHAGVPAPHRAMIESRRRPEGKPDGGIIAATDSGRRRPGPCV